MKFRFIDDHQGTWPVRTLCRALGVSPSGYYAWRSRPESARTAANRLLLDAVRRLHARHHGRYGSPRLHAALRAEGRGVSRGRIGSCPMAWCSFGVVTTLTVWGRDDQAARVGRLTSGSSPMGAMLSRVM
jgi:HTH-like domain